jgi:hydrogenase nickel incorporation protein HypA/HybF
MHEVGLCEGVLDAVERRAAGRRVSVVRVRAGALHRIVEPAMRTAFELVAAGSVAQGAEFELVAVPVLVRCRDCGLEVESDDSLAACGRCGSTDLDLSGGDELTLESVTFAEGGTPVPEKEMGHVPGHPG